MVVKWQDYLPVDAGKEEFFTLFKKKAEELTVEVVRVPSPDRALEMLVERMESRGIRRAVASPLTLIDTKSLENRARSHGIDLSFDMELDRIEKAGIGISQFDLGIAESGTLVQDASGLHARLVSMLPPVHLALVSTAAIVGTFSEALSVIEKVYRGTPPPFLSFITGPSKTADIERVLTIGVHGPKELIVLFVDE